MNKDVKYIYLLMLKPGPSKFTGTRENMAKITLWWYIEGLKK